MEFSHNDFQRFRGNESDTAERIIDKLEEIKLEFINLVSPDNENDKI